MAASQMPSSPPAGSAATQATFTDAQWLWLFKTLGWTRPALDPALTANAGPAANAAAATPPQPPAARSPTNLDKLGAAGEAAALPAANTVAGLGLGATAFTQTVQQDGLAAGFEDGAKTSAAATALTSGAVNIYEMAHGNISAAEGISNTAVQTANAVASNAAGQSASVAVDSLVQAGKAPFGLDMTVDALKDNVKSLKDNVKSKLGFGKASPAPAAGADGAAAAAEEGAAVAVEDATVVAVSDAAAEGAGLAIAAAGAEEGGVLGAEIGTALGPAGTVIGLAAGAAVGVLAGFAISELEKTAAGKAVVGVVSDVVGPVVGAVADVIDIIGLIPMTKPVPSKRSGGPGQRGLVRH